MYEYLFFQTVSGRPPPAASMAVGQFFNPKDGNLVLSPLSLLYSAYSEQVFIECFGSIWWLGSLFKNFYYLSIL